MDSHTLQRWYRRRFGFGPPDDLAGYQWRQPTAEVAKREPARPRQHVATRAEVRKGRRK